MSSIDWNRGINALDSLNIHLRKMGGTKQVETLLLMAKRQLTEAATMKDPITHPNVITKMLGVGENLIRLVQFLNERIANARREITKARLKKNDALVSNWKGVLLNRNSAIVALLGCGINDWYGNYLNQVVGNVPINMKSHFTSVQKKIDAICLQAKYLYGSIKGQHFSVISSFPSDLDHQGRFVIGRSVSPETGSRTYFLLELPFLSTKEEESKGIPIVVHTDPLPRAKFASTLYSFDVLKHEKVAK